MNALSIRQPWAWLIVQGHKPIENRAWFSTHRGPFLIHVPARQAHAAKTMRAIAEEILHDMGIEIPSLEALPYGCICGEAELTLITHPHHADALPPQLARWAAPGQWHWHVAHARPTRIVPCRGAQRFWRPPANVVAACRLPP